MTTHDPFAPPPRQKGTRRREPIFNAKGRGFTLGFALACVAVYLFQQAAGLRETRDLFEAFGLVPYYFLLGIDVTYHGVIVPSWANILTHMLLHDGFWHLALNMLALVSFGGMVERTIRTWRMAVLFLVGGVVAGLAEVWLSSEQFILMVGASGAIFAVVGAYVMLWPFTRVYLLVIPMPGWVLLAVIVVLHLVLGYGLQLGGIAWWAHMGGLAAGMLLILVLRPRGVVLFQQPPPPPPIRRRRPTMFPPSGGSSPSGKEPGGRPLP